MSTSIQTRDLPLAQTPDTPDAPAVAKRRTYLRPRSGWQAIGLDEVWRARDLLWSFTLRDISVRYKQTFFGFAWAIVVPVIQIVVFTVFFGKFLGVSDRVDQAAGRALPYPLFALTGQLIWNFFRATVDGASNSLMSNAAIIRKIYVPRLVLPLSSLGRPVVDSLAVFVLMFGLLAWYATDANFDVWLSPKLLLSPLLLVGAAIPALGVGLLIAALTVNYRDLRYVHPFVMQTLFYVTPVIYPVDILPEGYRWLLYLNPASGFVAAHRSCVMDLPIDWLGLAISLAVSLAILVVGLFYFARTERHFADVA